jgi:phosphoribosylaminoimidazolecarboxamide formyltransferase / IMP cyclohydrolase
VSIAVCVSGQGSNLRAIVRAVRRGRLADPVVLVLADRPCTAVEWAASQSIPTWIIRPADHPDAGAWDRAVAGALLASGARVVALAGFMRILGPATLAAFPGRILNVHPSLLPAFPGAHAVRDALAAGVAVTGVTIHLVDDVLDGGPIVLQEAIAVMPGDDEESLLARLHAVEHRLLPRALALLAGGAVRVGPGRRVVFDDDALTSLPRPRRALVSVSDKSGLADLARGLDALGFELVSTGGTASALRGAGLEVTDVATVTGFPEMLDGRVKTLHPAIEAGVLADMRLPEHVRQLATAGIEAFELVVVNLYPFADAAERSGITIDELVEEIDIGGPTLVRAAAKNHASVGIVTDPGAYAGVLEELRSAGSLGEETRRRLAVEAFRHTAAYDARIAAELPARFGMAGETGGVAEAGAAAPAAVAGTSGDASASAGDGVVAGPSGDAASPAMTRDAAPDSPAGAPEVFPSRVHLELEREQALRYGENPHQAAAVYRVAGMPAAAGPFARGVDLRQGKPLSYNNLLDASAAAALARDLHGPACVIVKHTNPCGAAEAVDPLRAWELALAGDRVSAFGGVVALTRPIDALLAERLAGMFLEVVVAPSMDADAADVLARRPNLRVVIDPCLGDAAGSPVVEYRSAGGAILATQSDVLPDDPAGWRVATARTPDERERRDLELAWRIVRHVKSNAIVLVRDGALVGTGAGQMSRVDSARLAVAKAGPDRCVGAACASDAFYPFPDGLLACAEAGVSAFVQPGGSMRDDEVIAAADAAGVSMLLTGLRHFRH